MGYITEGNFSIVWETNQMMVILVCCICNMANTDLLNLYYTYSLFLDLSQAEAKASVHERDCRTSPRVSRVWILLSIIFDFLTFPFHSTIRENVDSTFPSCSVDSEVALISGVH